MAAMKLLLYGAMVLWLAFASVAIVDNHAAARLIALVHRG